MLGDLGVMVEFKRGWWCILACVTCITCTQGTTTSPTRKGACKTPDTHPSEACDMSMHEISMRQDLASPTWAAKPLPPMSTDLIG